MRTLQLLTAAAVLLATASAGLAGQISGEYIEARTCKVYTGPCFANGEMDLAGKEALMAWKVEQGIWNDTALDGLSVALVVGAENTLGNDGVFNKSYGKIRSVILVDQQADEKQRQALVDFVKTKADKKLTENVVRVTNAPLKLDNDHIEDRGVFSAGDLAKIETRKIQQSDCVCSNEIVFYQPLNEVENAHPAYSKTLSFEGKGLDNQWTHHGMSSAFLATFRY